MSSLAHLVWNLICPLNNVRVRATSGRGPRTCRNLGTEGGGGFVNIDFVERASLLQPRLEFAADGRYLTVRLPELAHQLHPLPNGGCVAFDLPIRRHFLYQEPAAGLYELDDALEGALWFRKL